MAVTVCFDGIEQIRNGIRTRGGIQHVEQKNPIARPGS
jgi:hypothetical protein